MRAFISEIRKNFKLLFRNWTTLALLILGPLLLILLVGYAFSGSTAHDIRIGVVSEELDSLSGLISNVETIGDVIPYQDVLSCISSLEHAELHLCLEIQPQNGGDVFTGQVTFYFDPTRKKITLVVIDQLKSYFGLKAEEISILSAQTLLDNIQSLVAFIKDHRADIDDIQNESISIKKDLIERKAQLEVINATFTPPYRRVRASYSRIEPLLGQMENSSLDVMQAGQTVQQQMELVMKFNAQAQNMTVTLSNFAQKINALVPGLIPANFTSGYINATGNLNTVLVDLNKSLSLLVNTSNTTVGGIVEIKKELDTIIGQIDTIVALLEFEIERTDAYIKVIDRSSVRLDELGKSIDERLSTLDVIEPGLAEKLVRPITQRFQSIIPSPPNVQIVFPVLLSIMILFISLLFANIVSLLEIYNKAYIRNILAPINDLLFMTGLIITNFLVVFFQVVVLLIVAQTQFKVDIINHITPIFSVSLILIGIFVFLGMIIANITKSIQSSILLTTFTALVFFLFSDIVTSLETMPIPASVAASFNPVVISIGMIRRILFFDQGLTDLLSGFVILLIYALILLIVLTIVTKKKNMRRF